MTDIRGILDHAGHNLMTKFLMRVLAATEHERHLDAVAFQEEVLDVTQLGVVVVLLHIGVELHFLDLGAYIGALGLLLLLLHVVAVLAVIHKPADGRLGLGCDFNEIDASTLSELKGFAGGDYTKLCAINIDAPDFRHADLMINAGKRTNSCLQILDYTEPAATGERLRDASSAFSRSIKASTDMTP